jgi:hypothetical protein
VLREVREVGEQRIELLGVVMCLPVGRLLVQRKEPADGIRLADGEIDVQERVAVRLAVAGGVQADRHLDAHRRRAGPAPVGMT